MQRRSISCERPVFWKGALGRHGVGDRNNEAPDVRNISVRAFQNPLSVCLDKGRKRAVNCLTSQLQMC